MDPRITTLGIFLIGVLSIPGSIAPPSGEEAASTPPAATAAEPGLLRSADSIAQDDALAAIIRSEARRTGLSPALIAAVIFVESSGNPRAVSHAGAIGLMQLKPGTARAEARRIGLDWMGEETLFDPIANVRLGVSYLDAMIGRFDGDLELALAAYNAGPTRVAAQIRQDRTVPAEYSRRVIEIYESSFGARSGSTAPI